MSDRREPTISSIMMDGRENSGRHNVQAIAEAQKKERAHAAMRERSARDPNTLPSPSAPPEPIVVKSKLAPFTFLLVLLLAGGAGYTFWSLQQTQILLGKTNSELEQSNARIAELEGRLNLSDDNSLQSMSALQANVKENSSEIRKLWGVSNDRNKKSITELESSFASLRKTVSGFDSQVKKASEELGGELKVLGELVEAQQAEIDQTGRLSSSIQKNVTDVQGKLKRLDRDLSKKILNNEDAIKAIDAFRLQVNRNLLQLKGGSGL